MTVTNTEATNISERLEQVYERIKAAASRASRDPADITVVAVTKTHPPDVVETAYELGLRHFGENRAEEAAEKIPHLAHLSEASWHMIGHIQSRKARDVTEMFSRVHSVDRLKIARRLSSFAGEHDRTLAAMLEVNLTGEESKYGFDLSHWPDDTSQLSPFYDDVEAILELPHLHIDGLMTMAPFTEDMAVVRLVFVRLAKLRDHLASRYAVTDWQHLSMGMTGDFEVAIEEGATMLRIGTAIFGPRNY